MILLAGVLVLAAVALLVLGLVQGSPTLQWASFAASALAAVVIVAGEVRRHLTARGTPTPSPEPPSGTGPEDRPPARTSAESRTPPAEARAVEPPTSVAPAAQPSHDPPASEPPVHEPPAYQPPAYQPPAYEPPAEAPTPQVPAAAVPAGDPAAGGGAGGVGAGGVGAGGVGAGGEPPVEEVEMTDLLVVMDLVDEVLVVDEHPRYHLVSCPYVAGQETFALPLVEARTDGFTPCGTCAPDRHLARVERSRRGRG